MAGKYNFTIEQGSDFYREITWKDSSGQPVDLAGYTARMKIKDALGRFIDELTSIAGITLGPAAGHIVLAIDDTKTQTYTFDSAYYDLEMVAPGNRVKRLLKGVIILSTERTT